MSLPSEVDVLVAGFGPAGAAAALAARATGADVAVVEKTAEGGGNCVHSGGFMVELTGAGAVDHLDAVCFGKTPRPVLEAYAAGLPELPGWLAELGGRTEVVDPAAFGGMLPCWPHFAAEAHAGYRQFISPAGGPRPGRALWDLLDGAVRDRGIPIATGTRVVELVLDGPAVRGAVVERVGARHTIRARHGVILASGSFEADPELRDTYLPLPLVGVGHPGNTGDTLRLAAQAGASLWHMSAFFGWFAFVHPDFPVGFTLDVHAPSFILLDGDGRRFTDETGWEVHDKVRSATVFSPRRPNRPNLPGWIVFDEAARRAGPLHGIVGSPNGYTWSPDNQAEIDRGWIARGGDAHELAVAAGIEPVGLSDTLDRYAAAVAGGRDELFGRDPRTLAGLEPPLYAIPMHAGVATASGGPRRDERARVLAPGGSPVPGLYAAGAAGSIWGHLTEHGGGLTDAMVFGRIAGREAAGIENRQEQT